MIVDVRADVAEHITVVLFQSLYRFDPFSVDVCKISEPVILERHDRQFGQSVSLNSGGVRKARLPEQKMKSATSAALPSM